MPRSAYLTNIAAGLCGSFASRNNHLDGYWAVGRLRSLAVQHGQGVVSIDLLTPSIQPASAAFAPVLARYRQLLETLADISGVAIGDITKARIVSDFAPPPWTRAGYDKAQWGEQFVLTVTICATGRVDGIVRHAGYCRPHDPARERRSNHSPLVRTTLPFGAGLDGRGDQYDIKQKNGGPGPLGSIHHDASAEDAYDPDEAIVAVVRDDAELPDYVEPNSPRQ